MELTLNRVRDRDGAHKRRRPLGRGIGSGRGKTCSRGGKGQTARTGVSIRGFEGGQTPKYRRLPKRGFVHIRNYEYVELNIGRIQELLDSGKVARGETITAELLQRIGFIKNSRSGIKLLGAGELKEKVSICAAKASKSAIALVEKLGGTCTIEAFVPCSKEKAQKGSEAEDVSKASSKSSKKGSDSDGKAMKAPGASKKAKEKAEE